MAHRQPKAMDVPTIVNDMVEIEGSPRAIEAGGGDASFEAAPTNVRSLVSAREARRTRNKPRRPPSDARLVMLEGLFVQDANTFPDGTV